MKDVVERCQARVACGGVVSPTTNKLLAVAHPLVEGEMSSR